MFPVYMTPLSIYDKNVVSSFFKTTTFAVMDEEVKTKILQLKLQRIQELNLKLKQSLLRDRIPTSQASLSYV